MNKTVPVCHGNTLMEYGMLLGLVAVACLVGLRMFGVANADLLSAVPNAQSSLMGMMHLKFDGGAHGSSVQGGAGSVSLQGAGYYRLTINPQNGRPELHLTDSGSGSITNATSIDGSQWNILGQFHLADSLMALAAQQTNPANAEYIRQLANQSYYMGGAEGEIDAVKGFEIVRSGGDPYGKLNGYVDIQRLQGDMQTALNNPPSSMDAQTLRAVFALSSDVYNIGQSYVTAMAPYASQSTNEFRMPSDVNTGGESGTPGQALTTPSSAIVQCGPRECGTSPSLGGPTIEQMLSISQLQTLSNSLLGANGVDATQPVKATLTDATTLNKASASVASGSTPVP